jgi:hypothetical protein
LPLALSGGLGGTLETERAMNYLNPGEEQRNMCNLCLSLMDCFGVKLEQFGGARMRLEQL